MRLVFGIMMRCGGGSSQSSLDYISSQMSSIGLGATRSFLSRECSMVEAFSGGRDKQSSKIVALDGLVFAGNVRLDNRDELIAQFDSSLDPASSDAYLVLWAYRKWGRSCVEQLLGDFAFAVWDQVCEQLLIARDRIGVYPIYYYKSCDFLAFSSELGVLGMLAEVSNEPDYEWFANTVAGVWLPDMKERTFLKSVRLLPSARFLFLSGRHLAERSYWKLDSGSETDIKKDSDCLERFRELFSAAVARRLPQSGPIGIELSAGLDSSAIATVVSKDEYHRKRLVSFSHIARSSSDTLGIDRNDEMPLTMRLADELGLGGVRWICGPDYSVSKLFSYPLRESGGLGLESWSLFAKPLYEEASQRDVSVLLSGAGGDELISSQATGAYWEFLLRGDVSRLTKEIRLEGCRKKWGVGLILKRMVSTFLYSGFPAFSSKMGSVASSSISHFLVPEIETRYSILERARESRRFILSGRLRDRQEKLLCNSYLSSCRLPQSFASAFDNQLEVRYPMLDTSLIEFCYSLPPRMFRKGGFGRALIREGIAEIPDEVKLRDDKSVPAIPWVEGYLGEQAGELIQCLSKGHRLAEFLDLHSLQQELEVWAKSGRARDLPSRRPCVLSLAALCN